jgi:hypothetical protein
MLTGEERRRLHRTHSGRVGLTESVAFILLGVVTGYQSQDWLLRLPADDRRGIELLARQGLIEPSSWRGSGSVNITNLMGELLGRVASDAGPVLEVARSYGPRLVGPCCSLIRCLADHLLPDLRIGPSLACNA